MNLTKKDNIKVLISEEEIHQRVVDLGKEITSDNKGKELLVIGMLNGAFVFMSDLIRQIVLPLKIEFMKAKSYIDTKSTGDVNVSSLSDSSFRGKDILIVEDIIDTGNTMKKITAILKEEKANSVKIAVLLDKPSRREVEMKADYVGFEIEDKFVVGYGLDYNQKYRELSYIGEVNL